MPSHTARSPVKSVLSPQYSGGSVANASSEMGLPSTVTRTAPFGKAHFAAAYCRAIRSSAAYFIAR